MARPRRAAHPASPPPLTMCRTPLGRLAPVLGLVAWACLVLGSGGCGGGGGGGSAAWPEVTSRPDGTPLLPDPHQYGRATRIHLIEVTYGRLVDVHDVDASGNASEQPVLQDVLIDPNLQTDAGRYTLTTNPTTLATRLVIRRGREAPDDGRGTFESLLVAATRNLPPVLPRADDPTGPGPFTVVPRNACLSLRFDDLLDGSPLAAVRLADAVRVEAGYGPSRVPLRARVLFDQNHGAMQGESFRPTRVLVDPTVSSAERSGHPVPLPLNGLGLPASEPGRGDPNVVLRLGTRPDPGGSPYVVRSISGAPLDTARNGPVDAAAPGLDVVRALRAGNREDRDNGFLPDRLAPELVAAWDLDVEEARVEPDEPGGTFRLALTFATVCQGRLLPGDVIEVGSELLEVLDPSTAPLRGRVDEVRVRAIGGPGIGDPSALLGRARLRTTLDPDLPVPPACWLDFSPRPGAPPAALVQPDARLVLRFSEPMDPEAMTAFDAWLVQRQGSGASEVPAEDLVVAEVLSAEDGRAFVFQPDFSFAHEPGKAETMRVVLDGARDLAGNPLRRQLPPIEFTLDPDGEPSTNRSISLRFSSFDEAAAPVPILHAPDENDFRGQFVVDVDRGVMRGRAPNATSYPADRSWPVPSVMFPFAPGVATPLTPFGSKLQYLWRYVDFGFLPFDESRFDLDVIGLSWSPSAGAAVNDLFPEFEMRLGHSKYLPDEKNNFQGVPLGPLRHSGLAPLDPFASNLFEDPAAFQKVVHPREHGYRISTLDRYRASTGTLMMPYPMNRTGAGPLVSYTWRDTGILGVGTPTGNGIPLDVEIGPPISLFPKGTPKRYNVDEVPSFGLPLLVEIRCYPTTSALGLNALDVSFALNGSHLPAFRVFSSGGINVDGLPAFVDPDSEPVPLGGYNPASSPPGQRTGNPADNTFYIGQIDTIIRVSRAHSVWIDSQRPDPEYLATRVLPTAAEQPPGTSVVLDYRGATGFVMPEFQEELPFVAGSLDAYGNLRPDLPETGAILYLDDDRSWKGAITEFSGARFFQVRVTFVNDIDARTQPELSALGISYRDR